MPAASPLTPPRLLLIGWDGADWEFLHPLLDRGELPALNALVDAGVIGNLATLAPCLSPLLWTSIATGQSADRHGVLGFVEPTPDGAGVRKVSSTSRRSPAVWNVATGNGLKSVVVGWYASHPAEPIDGVAVSEAFFEPPARPPDAPWPTPAGAVWPPELVEPLAGLRLHPAELGGEALAELIPDLATIDVGQDHRPFRLAEILARDVSTQAVATALLENEPWNFAAVFFPGLDTAGHYFMPYHPPKMPGVPDREFELYRGVMTGLYKFYDRMLAGLLRHAGDDAHVMLVSDHGFQSGGRRPSWVNSDRAPDAHAADWHRSLGVFALKGPGVVADDRIHGATLLDVAPTALALLGLAADATMPGRVLSEAFPDRRVPPRVPDWSAEPGGFGMHPAGSEGDPAAAAAALLQLAELGYLPALPAESTGAVRLAVRESQFNLATVHQHHGRFREALAVLRPLRETEGDDPRLLLSAARCHHLLGEHREALDVLAAWPEGPDVPASESVDAHLILAGALHALGRTAEAKEALEGARAMAPESVEVWRMLGDHAIGLAAWPTAERAFARAAAIDPDHPGVRHGLGVCALKRKDYGEALGHCRAAVGTRYFFPGAHYHLAVAALRLGDVEGALASARLAIRQAPRFEEAYELALGIEQSRGRLLEVAALRQGLDEVRAAVAKGQGPG